MVKLWRSAPGVALFLGCALVGCGNDDRGDRNDPAEQTTETRSGALTTPLFQPAAAYATGSYAEAVAIGDLDGDGRNDVAILTSFLSDPANDYMVHVFIQNADGTLKPRVRYPVGGRSRSMDIGDVNGDGRADVVVGIGALPTGPAVVVLLQNATGTLDPFVSYPTANANQVKVADFNGDGRTDVAGLSWGSDGTGVDVLLQTNMGALASPVTYAVSHGGYDELDAGDVDGDGRTDLVVMSGQLYAIPNVSVLPQLPDGTFGAPAPYFVGTNIVTHGVAVGDTNGDGRSDIVVSYGGNRPTSFIGRFLQNAGGTLDPIASYPSYEIPSAIVLADVDADGRNDALVTHSGWDQLGVYRQSPSGNFLNEELYWIPYASQYEPQALAVGDINGDGWPDAVIADYNHGLVVLRHVQDVPLALTVTAPTAAASMYTNALSVAWTTNVGVAATVRIELSRDGGATWATVAASVPNTGTSSGSVAGPGTADARIRVTTNGSVTAKGTSASFTLLEPMVAVTGPAAGSVLYAGMSSAITWSSNLPATSTATVELSRDGGATYAALATNVPNTGSLAWIVAGPATGAARIRVTVTGPGSTSATSGAFAIALPSLAVTGPAAGASFYTGAPVAITWATNLPPTSPVLVELSRDGGATFETLAAAAPNTGSFAWVATGPDAAAAVARVTIADPVALTSASGAFAIATPSLIVTGPAAGTVAYGGTLLAITWTHNLPDVDPVAIELSRDGGATFEVLAVAAPNTGSFAWTVSGAAAAEARVRVTSTGAVSASGVGPAFSIVNPTLAVTSPTAGASWAIGTARTIAWSSTNLPAGTTVLVELSRDAGATWTTLASAAPATGTQAWTATGPATSAAIVRVTANGGVPAAATSGAFAIGNPALTVTSPAAGATWTIGTAQAITWTTNLLPSATVKVQISRNGGSTYTTLASAAPNTGSYAWTPTASATTTAIVKLSANGFTATGVSGTFSLVAPTVTVTAPNTAVTWTRGTVHAVTWNHNVGAGATFTIEVSRSGVWSVITTTAVGGAASGSYDWTVTGPTTTNAKIRVTWNGPVSAKDTSDVSFRIN